MENHGRLVLDGFEHGEFHLRFLGYSLAAGFDPFKLVADDHHHSARVFDHDESALAATRNVYSSRMYAILEELARRRYPNGENEPQALPYFQSSSESGI